MKKLFVCGAVLSLMLMACGDDSSSSPDPVAGGDDVESSGSIDGSSGSQDPSSSAGAESSGTNGASSGSQPASSGSQPSSSGSQNPESSADVGSSSSVAGNPVQKVKVGGKCMESKGNSNIPGGDGLALPPHAIMGQEEGSDIAVVVVENVMMPDYQISGFAGMIVNPALLDSVEVMAVGDTLYVKQIVDEAKAEGGSKCVTEFYFKLKADPAFTNTSIIVVGDYMRSTIDKQSSVPSSSSTTPSSSSAHGGSAAVPLSNISLECLPNHDFDGNSAQCEAEPYPYMSSIARLDGLAKLTIINANLNLPCGLDEDSVDSVITEAKKAMARSGANLINDTLFVNIDRTKGVEYTCGCNARVEFLFDRKYEGFGYTAFDNNGPTEVIDAAKDRPRQIIEDAPAQCRNSNNGDDPLTDGGSDGPRAGDGAIPPVAYMYELGNKAEIVIETVQMNCAVQIENIDVSVGGDTLYVKPNIDESAPQANCICPTQLDFYIEAEEAFRNATLLVFDYGWNTNPSNKMPIVKETHVTPAN